MQIHLRIADYLLRIYSDEKSPYQCQNDRFSDFESMTYEPVFIDIELLPKEALAELSGFKKMCEAHFKQQPLWSIWRNKDQYALQSYCPYSGQLDQIALSDEHLRSWKIYDQQWSLKEPSKDSLIWLRYPMCSLILYHITLIEPVLMIHASGVYDGQHGRLFSGISGVGKSTMARIWSEQGAQVIQDDRLLLRYVEGKGWKMYSSPMLHAQNSLEAPLHELYFLKQGPSFIKSPLSTVSATTKIYSNSMVQTYDAKHITHHLHHSKQLAQDLKIFELESRPESEVVDFIKNKA